MPADFEWTIEQAPEPGEPSPVPSRVRRSPKAWRRVQRLLVLIIAGTLAGLWGDSQWNAYWLRQNIEQTVVGEEQAARLGDITTLFSLSDPNNWTWRQAQLQLAANHQPAPLPSQALRLMPDVPATISQNTLAPDVVRADVTRSFQAPDGRTLQFTLPQFYYFADGKWRRQAPPAATSPTLQRDGLHSQISYDAADSDFVEHDLGPYLDDTLQRACAAWQCPAKTQIKLAFASSPTLLIAREQTPLPRGEALLFAFMRSQDLSFRSDTLWLPALYSAGYPANTISGIWLARAIAVQALGELAGRITLPEGDGPSRNAFLFALVERMATRLGVEPRPAGPHQAAIAVADSRAAGLSTNVNVMWDLGLRDSMGGALLGQYDSAGNMTNDNDPALRDEVMARALAMVDWLLRDQPASTEAQLFHGLKAAPDQVAWLSQGLGISADDAWSQLQLAVWRVNQVNGQTELALACDAGAALAAPEQARPVFFRSWQHTWPGAVLAYSPHGHWLAMDDGGQPVIVSPTSGTFVEVSALFPPGDLLFRGWISDSVAAFLALSANGADPARVVFVDMANPGRNLPPILGLADYALSPDKTLAAIITNPEPISAQRIQVAVIPSQGGTATPIDDAVMPDWPYIFASWSPDSKALAYAHLDPASGLYTLRAANPTTGASHEILNGRDLDSGAASSDLIAWSPDGKQIAFTLQTPQPGIQSPSWLGVVSADGTGFRLLRRGFGGYRGLSFSADGKYLAASSFQYQEDSGSSTVDYDTQTNSAMDAIGHAWSFGSSVVWSPTGHQLAVIDGPGVGLISDIAHPQRQPLAPNICGSVAWRPAP